jgi:uncharacterized protein (DUF433 family)
LQLKANDVILIRQRYSSGESINDILKDYVVSKRNINDVIRKKTWKYLDDKLVNNLVIQNSKVPVK